MSLELIVTGENPADLVQYAATELAQYAKRLFGLSPAIACRPESTTGETITLDSKAPPLPCELSDQGYVLREVQSENGPLFQVAGGSATATMWAVYDLVERWGVRYELHADLLPDNAGVFRFPQDPVACEPQFPSRVFRTYGDFANNTCYWPAEDYRKLIAQLAKMRINGIAVGASPYDPFVDLEFGGVRKQLAVTNFGWRYPLRKDHPGYDLFVESGDAARQEFSNPDLDHHRDYQAAHQAAKEYISTIFGLAHERGMQCFIGFSFTDFDPVIRQRLVELTDPAHKAPAGTVVRVKYGEWREGPDIEVGRCMSIKNPVYFDLMAKTIQAHIDCVPDADVYVVGRTEFGGPPTECKLAWDKLDRRYAFSNVATLEELVAKARHTAEDDAERSERELRSDIVTLYMLDKLLNERGFDMTKTRPGARVICSGLSPELHQFLPLLFPHEHYIASLGYMPTHVAKRMDTVRLSDPEALKFSVVTSLEDDNIGMVPQLTGPSLHAIVEDLRSVGGHGVVTRQWMFSNLLPTLHFLTHTTWEPGWTPSSAYEHLLDGLCGHKALATIHEAFRIIEALTAELHEEVICISFPVPNRITNSWFASEWSEQYSPKRMTRISRLYKNAAIELERAIQVCLPAGKGYLRSFERHVSHAVYYTEALAELGRGHKCFRESESARESQEFDLLDSTSEKAAHHVGRSAGLMRKACETFAEGVRDRVDLGALATLNIFNLDVVDALACIVRRRASMFSVVETPSPEDTNGAGTV